MGVILVLVLVEVVVGLVITVAAEYFHPSPSRQVDFYQHMVTAMVSIIATTMEAMGIVSIITTMAIHHIHLLVEHKIF
jgi:hypothetical protein